MIQQNEIIMLLLGVGCMIFIFLNKQKVKRIPVWRPLFAGFCVVFAGYVFTIIEGFLWSDLLNFLEHICYTASSILLAVWCWKIFSHRKGR
jgi:hypothetical protein